MLQCYDFFTSKGINMKTLKIIFLALFIANFAFANETENVDNGSLINPIACFACHKEQFSDWETSLHAKSHADFNPLYQKAVKLVATETHRIYEQVLVDCGTCHNPKMEKKFVSENAAIAMMFDIDTTIKEELKNAMEADHIKSGISCYICHNVDSIGHRYDSSTVGYELLNWTKGNLIVGPYELAEQQSIFHSYDKRDFFRENNDLCLACHQGQANKNELAMYNTGNELESIESDDKCVNCHMGSLKKGIIAPDVKRDTMIERDIKSHFFAGARNSDILKDAVDVNLIRDTQKSVLVNISNKITHGIPSGFSGRSLVLELTFLNDQEVLGTKEIDFRSVYKNRLGLETLAYAANTLVEDTRLKPKETREIQIEIPDETNSIKVNLGYFVLAPQLQKVLEVDDEVYTKKYEILSKEFLLK